MYSLRDIGIKSIFYDLLGWLCCVQPVIDILKGASLAYISQNRHTLVFITSVWWFGMIVLGSLSVYFCGRMQGWEEGM